VFTSERGGPSQRIALTGWSSVPAKGPSCRSSATPTCSDIRQATSSLATVTIHCQSRTTWVIAIFGTPCAIRSFLPSRSAIFGATENRRGAGHPSRLALLLARRVTRGCRCSRVYAGSSGLDCPCQGGLAEPCLPRGLARAAHQATRTRGQPLSPLTTHTVTVGFRGTGIAD
jgi:hypothetical protein